MIFDTLIVDFKFIRGHYILDTPGIKCFLLSVFSGSGRIDNLVEKKYEIDIHLHFNIITKK